jgi:hypothetical protein
MKGFAGSLDEQTLENLRNHPDVRYQKFQCCKTCDILLT